MIVFADPRPESDPVERPRTPSPFFGVALISAIIILAAIGTTTVLAVEHI